MAKTTLEQRVAALEAAADPQTIRNALERTWDPRGGEPRIIDADGNTLDFQGSIQFLNATATVDPIAQRVIVTPAGGASGMAGEFSDDDTTTDNERIKFVAQSGPAVNHLVLDTLSFGTTRAAALLLLEDTTSLTDPGARMVMVQDPAGVAQMALSASAAANAQASLVAQDDASSPVNTAAARALCSPTDVVLETGTTSLAGASVLTTVKAANSATGTSPAEVAIVCEGAVSGLARASVSEAGTGGTVDLRLNADGSGATATVAVDGVTETLLDDAGASTYLRVATDTTSAAAVVRHARGPFSASPGALAAGASATVLVASALPTTGAPVVAGGVLCAAGSGGEAVVWSWARNGANDVDISFTNLGAGAHTVTLEFFTFGD